MNLKLRIALAGVSVLALIGCNTDMWVQPKTDTYRGSEFYADGASARPLVPGTIPRGHLRLDEGYFTGQTNGKWLKDIPMKVNLDLLKRGQERYDIYCTPCHGQLGDGNGMIANRGFTLRRPVGNYHTDRLRKMPAGHFYDVITNGYGAMFSYASRVEPQDRWAIVAYIRALQLAHHATPAEASEAQLMMPAEPEAPATNEEGGEH
ncbi:cytochrome c [soil metagenome]